MDAEQNDSEVGWEARRDDASGQIYYWNSVTGGTSWKPPSHFNTDNAIHPWTQVCDENGHVYYLNTETMETQWTPPPAAIEFEGDTPLSSNTSELVLTGGRGRRPSTAEQMTELNRLLSGEDDDREEEKSPGNQENAFHQVTNESLTPEVESKPALDTDECPWMMFINEGDDVPYYYNQITGECLWEPPQEFRRLHQDQPQPEYQQLEHIDASTAEPEKLELPGNLHTTDPQDEPADEVPEKVATQAGITQEFEEKMRQAIAAVSNSPASSTRLVPVHTPTIQHLAPHPEGNSISARISAAPLSSTRLSGSPDPSSGTTSTPAMTSRLDTVSPPAEDSSTLEEEIAVSVAEKEHQIADILEPPTPIDDGRSPVLIKAEAGENAGSINEENTVFQVAAISDADEDKDVENQTMILGPAEALLNYERDDDLDEAIDVRPDSVEAADDVGVESDVVVEGGAEITVADECSDPPALEQRIYMAALTLQCMARGFVARQRVQHKREEQQQENTVIAENYPESEGIGNTTAAFTAVTQENEENLRNLAHQTQQEESCTNSAAASKQSEDVPISNDMSAVLPSTINQQSASLKDQGNTSSLSEALSSVPSVVPVAPSSSISNQKQLSRSPISTRLPSVLDISRYFPQRRSVTPAHSGSTTTTNEQVAITRKKVELQSPSRHRACQQEAKDREEQLDSRRKEEERAQRAQVVEYQRIYRESRQAFKAEKQQLQEEKQILDNQRQHEAEAEKCLRIQTQHEHDAERTRNMTLVDSADRLVWEYFKTSGRPNEQNFRRFRDALTETFKSTQFPDKMCAERARELQERIKLLRHASWAVDSRLEAVELRLLSELHPLTDRQRPLQAKYASKLRRRLEQMLTNVQSWQHVFDDWEEHVSASQYWGSIQALCAPDSAISSCDESRRQYFLNTWRGAPGGDSLLHIAAWNGWDKHVQLLVDEGADVNLIDSNASHRTPLHEACRAGHVSVVEKLLRAGARLDAVDVSGDSALHVACREGWTRVVRILLMAANDLGDERDVSAVDNYVPLTLEDFFNIRNGKGRRAIDVATLPSIMDELQNYDYQLNGQNN